jgi:hypothetical protein
MYPKIFIFKYFFMINILEFSNLIYFSYCIVKFLRILDSFVLGIIKLLIEILIIFIFINFK